MTTFQTKLSVIIPTLNEAERLPACLSSLFPGMEAGLLKEVIIADGGSHDSTVKQALTAGCTIVDCVQKSGRGSQLRLGGNAAKANWLLFIHADTDLPSGWENVVLRFIREQNEQPLSTLKKAAFFRLRFDDPRWRARVLETIVWLRCKLFGLPYGDQGLLINKKHYCEVGEFKEIVLMEDVDMVRRITRSRLKMLDFEILTSADRYRRDGYLRRSLLNFSCLMRYFMGNTPESILRSYERNRK